MAAAQRMQVLAGHLAAGARADGGSGVQAQGARARAALPRFDTTVMEQYVDDLADLKEEVYELFRRRPDLLPPIIEDLTKGAPPALRLVGWRDALGGPLTRRARAPAEQHRELVRKCLLAVLEAGYSPLRFYTSSMNKYFYLGELLALVDLSLARRPRLFKLSRLTLCRQAGARRAGRPRARGPALSALGVAAQTVKMGVQYSLWGGSILNLGTERHRKAYFDDIDKFRLPGAAPGRRRAGAAAAAALPRRAGALTARPAPPGCFAMTELRHGSNVAALQTEAVLDVATDEWIINTPDEGATKWCAPHGVAGAAQDRLVLLRAGAAAGARAGGLATARRTGRPRRCSRGSRCPPRTAVARWTTMACTRLWCRCARLAGARCRAWKSRTAGTRCGAAAPLQRLRLAMHPC